MYFGPWTTNSCAFSSSVVSCANYKKSCFMRTSDIFIPHPSFERHLTKTKTLPLATGAREFSSLNNKRILSRFKCQIQLESIVSTKTKYEHAIYALATFERESTASISSTNSNLNFETGSESESDEPDLDDKEKLRRSNISQANKGKTPWNKGRKHSPETIQRIKERTRIAMQNPKIRKKLTAFGHAQSKETRVRIGEKVKEGWKKRREIVMLQEIVFGEWQNLIADVARLGFSGQDEFQWNSYQLIQEEIEKELKERKERRKLAGKLHKDKRAPKSTIQKMRIAEAIKAKWADPDYRERVHTGITRHHHKGDTEKKQSRRQENRNSSSSAKQDIKSETKSNFLAKKKKGLVYKDPMISSKLQMIKKIKNERDAIENKKQQAAKKAKLSIAKAEKAAKALEIAALNNPRAQAFLIESRNLISEAYKMLSSIEPVSNEIASDNITEKAPEINGMNITELDKLMFSLALNGRNESEKSKRNGISVNGSTGDDAGEEKKDG